MKKHFSNLSPLIIGSIFSLIIIIYLLIYPSGLIDQFEMSKNLIDHVQVLTFFGLLINIWFLQITYKQNQNQINENRKSQLEQEVDKNFYFLFNSLVMLQNQKFLKNPNKDNLEVEYINKIREYLFFALQNANCLNFKLSNDDIERVKNRYKTNDDLLEFRFITEKFVTNINFIIRYIYENKSNVTKKQTQYYFELLIINLSVIELNVLFCNKDKYDYINRFLIDQKDNIKIPIKNN